MGNNKVSSNTAAGSIVTAKAGIVNSFLAQDLTISGNGTVNKTPTAPAAGGLADGASAKAIATAINAFTPQSGVTAVPSNTLTISGVQQTGSVSFELKGANATVITIGATVSSLTDLGGIAQAINAQTGTTGITAIANKSGDLVLTNTTGEDIRIGNLSAAALGLTGASIKGADTATTLTIGATPGADVTVGGSVTFNSSTSFSISTSAGTTFLAGPNNGSSLSPVASIDISTAAGSTDALLTVDAALATVSSNRAALGAVQNRFLTTIDNLNTTSENLSASRSRIQDADFAMETANLSRTQILQQAGTAMVAQANQLPQGVLALLRQ
jgi:flagellin